MTAASTATIEAVELAKVYGDRTRALAGITFAAEPGEIFGLLGPTVPARQQRSGSLSHLFLRGRGRFTEFGGPSWYASRRHARLSARALGTGPAQEVV
jgi:ABC-type uncharacterized transport system ATPase subunit